MSYADCAGSDAVVGVELELEEATGDVAAVVGEGLALFTICQTNFFPTFTHFIDVAPDFVKVPTFGQGLPGVLAAVLEEEKANGAEKIATANMTEVMRREDFLREAFMRKTVLPNECQH